LRLAVQGLVSGWSRWKIDDDISGLEQALAAAHVLGIAAGIPDDAQGSSVNMEIILVGWAGIPLSPGAQVVLSEHGCEVEFDLNSYPRPDVQQAFGLAEVPNCGFVIRAPVTTERGDAPSILEIHVVDASGAPHAVKVPSHQSLVRASYIGDESAPQAYLDTASIGFTAPRRSSSPQWRAATRDPLGVISLALLAGGPEAACEWYRSMRPVVLNHPCRTAAARVALALGFDDDALKIGIEGSEPDARNRLLPISRPTGAEINIAGRGVPGAASVRFGYESPLEDAVVSVNEAHVYADGIVTATDELVSYEAAAEPCSPFVAGHWDKVAATGMRREIALISLPENDGPHLAEAIILTSRCAGNYFHALIEHTPRLLTLEAFPELLDLPLLLDEDTPNSVREAIRLIAPSANLLDTPRTGRLRVDRLHLPLIHSFVPDSTIYPFSSIRLSTRHLDFLREKLLPHKTEHTFPKRLFLGRLHGTRNVLNGAQLRTELDNAGFTIVDTENMSFVDQISLFHGATDIVGVAGAAFANTIFCNPKTRITAFYGEHNRGYPLQRMLAGVADAQFTEFYGALDAGAFADPQSRLHAPFSIPIPRFREHLRTFHSR
jgi:capsular polysaccharide biosynthesis protein